MQKADLITRFGPSLHSETRPARPANAASVGVCVCRTLTGGASSRSLASWFDTRAVASRGVALAGPVSTRRGGAGGVAQQPAIGSKGARIFIAIVCILALTLLHVDMLLYSRVRARTRRKFGTRFSHRSLVLTKRDAELGFMGGDDRGGGVGERRRRRRRVTAATSAGDGGRTGRERRSSVPWVPSVRAAAGRRRWSSGGGGRQRSSSSSATRRALV